MLADAGWAAGGDAHARECGDGQASLAERRVVAHPQPILRPGWRPDITPGGERRRARLLASVGPVASPHARTLVLSPEPFLDDRDGPRDECGVFGIVAPGREVARLTYFALYALQHRGQESAGIATSQGGHIMAMRDQGLVNQVFDEQKLRALQGDMAVGHVRYSTTGANSWENSQPVWRADKREVALGHNGNLVNAVELHAELREQGVTFRSHERLRDHRRAALHARGGDDRGRAGRRDRPHRGRLLAPS